MTPTKSSRVQIALAVTLLCGVVAVVAGTLVTGASRSRAQAAVRDEAAFGVDRSDVPAPATAVLLSNGGSLPLAGMRGQVVFVNFWATWCPPCREEMPSMLRLGDELTKKYPNKFRMVAVSVDDGWPEVEQYFGGQLPGTTIVARDPDLAATRAYYCTARGNCPQNFQFPETYIIDAQGRLVRYIIGPRDWANPAARRLLERLIEG